MAFRAVRPAASRRTARKRFFFRNQIRELTARMYPSNVSRGRFQRWSIASWISVSPARSSRARLSPLVLNSSQRLNALRL